MPNANNAEARFLLLASQPGMESLVNHAPSCRSWRGLGCNCLPLPCPVAERLGRLVELAGGCEIEGTYTPDAPWKVRLLPADPWSLGPFHWAALTEALLSSLEVTA